MLPPLAREDKTPLRVSSEAAPAANFVTILAAVALRSPPSPPCEYITALDCPF
uniref:Uncharacterized protein n=1 Tax=Arundo donax TaxID=35708 RepID=A0A0A9GG16_ARUDO